jgi:NAD-dependent dihydropyrimidine dehydrogenase PreA subunit
VSVLLVSHDHGGNVGRKTAEDSLAKLASQAGWVVLVLPHLYHLGEDDGRWHALATLTGPVAVAAWIHPRPIRALMQKHGAWGDGHRAFAFGAGDAAGLWAAITAAVPTQPSAPPVLSDGPVPSAPRWYPVIDAERCVNCDQCFQFCLFGVYARDGGGRVTVSQPDACKPGCPACSRICPQGAIIFPLYAKDPAIAGAPGLYPSPDASARQMFYQHTGQVCPRCGGRGRFEEGAGESCPECGRRAATTPGIDPLDDLIDALDRMQERRRG